MKVIVKVVFESQGRSKMAEKWCQENVNISPKKVVTCESVINVNIKDKFVTEENISGY